MGTRLSEGVQKHETRVKIWTRRRVHPNVTKRVDRRRDDLSFGELLLLTRSKDRLRGLDRVII